MNVDRRVIDISLLYGDGIGRPPASDVLGRRFDTTPDIESRLLVGVVENVVSRLQNVYGVEINLIDLDLSAEKRLMSGSAAGDLSNFYSGLVAQVAQLGGLALKLPTTTCTDPELRAVASGLDIDVSEKDDKWFADQKASPNAVLRDSLSLAFMTRAFPSTPGLENVPTEIAPLHVMSLDGVDGFFEGDINNGINNEVFRTLDLDVERIAQFAEKIVTKMGESGAEKVVLATKHTISKLDAYFTAALKVALLAKGMNEKQIESVLFDSFLPSILANKHKGSVVVCMPDQAEMLKGLAEISGTPLEAVETEDPLPGRMVFRLAQGSGYGETVDAVEDRVYETYTLNEQDVKIAFSQAKKLANEHGTKPCVVLIGGQNNPADDMLMLNYINSSFNPKSYTTVTMSDLMRDLALDPRDPRYSVMLTPNQIGDYLTDFLPALHCGALKNGSALGMGASTSYAYDEGGGLKTVLADPSTGTAPMLVDPNNADASKGILPVGVLLALANLLAASPSIISSQEVDPIFAEIGNELRGGVLETILDLKSRGITDYSNFVDVLFDDFMPRPRREALAGRF